MNLSRQEIAQIISQLDHQDGQHQRDAMDMLLQLGPEAIDPLVASINISEPRTRTAIIRVLGELQDPAALLPLMRFVYDRRDSIPDRDARGLAMEAIAKLSSPELAQRLFDFLLQVRQDPDAFVRGWAIEALSKFQDPRAKPIIDEAIHDTEEFVRLRARKAQQRIAMTPPQGVAINSLDGEQYSDLELLQKLRHVQGGERAYFIGLLKERPNAFELTLTLMQEGGKGAMIGLQIMQQLPDPRARQVATQYFNAEEDATSRAICLRILAAHLKADASSEEHRVIEAGLVSPDEFVRRAALAAAAASGVDPLIKQTLRYAQQARGADALEAAEALSRGTTPAQKRLLPELRDALHLAQQRRLGHDTDEHVQTEAHLLGAINNLLDDDALLGAHDLMQQALLSLKDAARHWPILVSALRLLRDLVGERDLPPEGRFSQTNAIYLVDLMDHEDDRVRSRVLDLLKRGAPDHFNAMTPKLERLIHDPRVDLVGTIIPLIQRANGERAKRLLLDLEQSKEPQIAQAAQDALRRLRNQQPVIEAKFTRAPE